MMQHLKWGLLALCILLTSHYTMGQKQRKLTVREIQYTDTMDLQKVSELLEAQTDLQTLYHASWEAFSYKPLVQFRIAHANNQIWLKYYVMEENILAARTEINSSVSRDSCVEFFFDPLGDGKYYNFEFNCIGTPHVAYGPGRHQREFVDAETIKAQIQIWSTLGNKPIEESSGWHQWEMVMVLPAAVLSSHPDIVLKGLSSKANFYKCEDDTAKKHYITWNPVGTAKPDYHRPEYFGTLIFE